MSRQTLKDARFRIIGYIDIEPGGRQTGRDDRFRILGYYDPATDITKDDRFRTIGYGNLLASLIHGC